jgi:predicted RNA-binding Zn-ribbon protein involved in translation (DUF1610 family)
MTSFHNLPFFFRFLVCVFVCIGIFWSGYDNGKQAKDAGDCLICGTEWTWNEDFSVMSCDECEWSVEKETYMDQALCPNCGKQGKFDGNYVNCNSCGFELSDIGYEYSYQLVCLFCILVHCICYTHEIRKGSWA